MLPRPSFLLLVACVVAAALPSAACDRERTARHEALAKTLAGPARLLCGDNKEGGGCNGDCQIWLAAERGRGIVEASEPILTIPPFADSETEALLDALRRAAGAAYGALAERCPDPIDRAAGMTPEVRRCAQAFGDEGARVGSFYAAFERLATQAEGRTGVPFPKPGHCP